MPSPGMTIISFGQIFVHGSQGISWWQKMTGKRPEGKDVAFRGKVFPGLLFSPWNLSVADSADPTKNRWLVNLTSHRAWDPVSGQADYKKLAARIEII